MMLVSKSMNEACSMRQWADVGFRSNRQADLVDQLRQFIIKFTKELGTDSKRPHYSKYIKYVNYWLHYSVYNALILPQEAQLSFSARVLPKPNIPKASFTLTIPLP